MEMQVEIQACINEGPRVYEVYVLLVQYLTYKAMDKIKKQCFKEPGLKWNCILHEVSLWNGVSNVYKWRP